MQHIHSDERFCVGLISYEEKINCDNNYAYTNGSNSAKRCLCLCSSWSTCTNSYCVFNATWMSTILSAMDFLELFEFTCTTNNIFIKTTMLANLQSAVCLEHSAFIPIHFNVQNLMPFKISPFNLLNIYDIKHSIHISAHLISTSAIPIGLLCHKA